MINKIAHLADIHISKVTTRNDEYLSVFNRLYESLRNNKPDRIVIVGDLVNEYIDLQSEQLIMISDFLTNLANIAPVRITRGNHDFLKKSINRIDSIEAIVKTIKNSNIVYYNSTGFFEDDNIVWAVWHHGDKNNNPWSTKEGKKYLIDERLIIDLFHDPLNGCRTSSGYDMKNKSYYNVKDFRGNISMFGDIHLMQYLNKDKTKAYCGSLLPQKADEGNNNFHGYLLWDVNTKKADEIEIYNDYSFKDVLISQFCDFNNLDFEIDNPTKYMKVRIIWNTLPYTRNKENERLLKKYLTDKYSNVKINNVNRFIEENKVTINDENDVTLDSIIVKDVQHKIFKQYLNKIGVDDKTIDKVIELDNEILKIIDIDDNSNIEWDVVKFGGKNFMSYESIDIDWRNYDGLFQIVGKNTAGKTTILKLLSYILYNKTIETENRRSYGDLRFINNRNNANFCDTYLVLSANGEYYGIKRRTDIKRAKDGTINGAPTTLSYYLLNTPDDEMNDSNDISKLNEDLRNKTQNKINLIIGTYENFNRVVLTTSDTLNKILSNEMATFIDSILFDSGLDIFDKKLEGYKLYKKKANEKKRIVCDVTLTENKIADSKLKIKTYKESIDKINTIDLPEVNDRIVKGKQYIEDMFKKQYKIDPEIYSLNVSDVNNKISAHENNIKSYQGTKASLESTLSGLKETYDKDELLNLENKKDENKNQQNELKLKIKTIQNDILSNNHSIEIINGDIFRFNNEINQHNKEIENLRKSKTCPTCKQPLLPEHQIHIDESINNYLNKINDIKVKITDKENEKPVINEKVNNLKIEIENINQEITKLNTDFDDILLKIGKINNDKNDVEKRVEINNNLEKIPLLISNEELNIKLLKDKLINYENSLKQIEENKQIDKMLTMAKERLATLEQNKNKLNEDIFSYKSSITILENDIVLNEKLIFDFKEQEENDKIMNLYESCVHRNGIPTQMLVTHILPKINKILEEVLSVSKFKIWLDPDDLRPKLMYYDRPDSIIDCISSSGKERTFSSISLKYALNCINTKSKPKLFLLDEIMGKLDDESIVEFNELIKMFLNNFNRILIIEHHGIITPDYIIRVSSDDDGISSLVIE